MTVFNLSGITYGDTFETWYTSSNEVIDSMNTILILDAQADTTRGLEETYRNGGVVIMGITAADGLGFNDDGQLGLSFSGVTIGTRTGVDDVILAIQSDGSVKGVRGLNILPPQVNNDIVFTGDIAFSGDLDFISNGTVSLSIDTSFRDKRLDLAVNFDDELEFAFFDTPTITEDVFFVDTAIVTDFSAFNSSATGTYIGRGVVLSHSNPDITVTDFVFNSSGDAFQEFTIAGASAGGKYALINGTGATRGRGLLDHTSTKSPASRQTTPTLANGAGFAVLTSDDGVIPSGGSAGEKLFTWLWNATSADSAWTSSENIQIATGKAFIGTDFISPTDNINKISQSTFIFDRYTSDGKTHGYAFYYDKSGDTFSFGGFTNGTTFTSNIQLNRDRTISAATTGLALNLNADLLDGAHGSTVGGTQNTIPITGTDGLIDRTFLPGSGRIEEIISQTSHGLIVGHCVRRDAISDFVPAIASSDGTATAVGIVTEVIDVNTFRLTYYGVVDVPDIYGFSLGLGYGGATIAFNEGDIYYLSESITGAVSDSKPSDSSSVTKAMFVALGEQKILINNQNARPSPVGDTINVESVVPVGSISFNGANNIGSNSDFLTCDGKVYTATDYPDLKPVIQGQFYIEGVATGGESSIVIYGSDSETRNFASGQTFQLTYNDDLNTLAVTLDSVTGISAGVRLGFSSSTLSGSDFYDDVELRGTGIYFVVPDLRSRGVVGLGDPNGSSNGTIEEGNFSHGDIVGIKDNTESDVDLGSNEYFFSDLNNSPYINSYATAVLSHDVSNLRSGRYKVDISIGYLKTYKITSTSNIETVEQQGGWTGNQTDNAMDTSISLIIQVGSDGNCSFDITSLPGNGSGPVTLRHITGIRIGD